MKIHSVLTLWLVSAACCHASEVEEFTIEDLASKSDLVVVARAVGVPRGTKKPALEAPDELNGFLKVVQSSFEIDHVFEGAHKGSSLVLEHFADARKVGAPANAFSILDFRPQPTRLTAADGSGTFEQVSYLLFLKSLGNGRYCLAVNPEWMESSIRMLVTPF